MTLVLLNDFIDNNLVQRIKEFIGLQPTREEFVLVIDSDGGNLSPAMDFVSYMKTLEGVGLHISVHIYNAKSMAAVIALSLGSNRRMSKTGSLELHRGSLTLEASDFDLETGKISSRVLSQFKMYDILLQRILIEYGISKEPKMMAELHGSGWLKLSPEKCLEFGLVQELF